MASWEELQAPAPEMAERWLGLALFGERGDPEAWLLRYTSWRTHAPASVG